MSSETLRNVGLAYRWLLAYYKDVAAFCGRVKLEIEDGSSGYVNISSDAIEVRGSKSLKLTQNWLPCYHYQFFTASAPARPEFEGIDWDIMLCIGIDHHDPEEPDRTEPLVYLARFGPIATQNLPQFKQDVVYFWTVGAGETEEDGWFFGTFQSAHYSYKTIPLSSILSLDDVRPKVIEPLIAHDQILRRRLGQTGQQMKLIEE